MFASGLKDLAISKLLDFQGQSDFRDICSEVCFQLVQREDMSIVRIIGKERYLTCPIRSLEASSDIFLVNPRLLTAGKKRIASG